MYGRSTAAPHLGTIDPLNLFFLSILYTKPQNPTKLFPLQIVYTSETSYAP
jgi:hypothetical protein